MIDILYYYVTPLCFLHALFQGLPAPANQVLGFLAGGYAVPAGLALTVLALWFEGRGPAGRIVGQRTALRGLVTALLAWGLAALVGLLWREGLSSPELEQAVGDWACWLGPPSASPAAAVGFALGATLWRWNWRWGLAVCLATGLWAVAQVCYGLCYPLDVVVGTALGAGLAWWLGAIAWLDRPLGVLIRLARCLTLA